MRVLGQKTRRPPSPACLGIQMFKFQRVENHKPFRVYNVFLTMGCKDIGIKKSDRNCGKDSISLNHHVYTVNIVFN